jgi:hypothetical protein
MKLGIAIHLHDYGSGGYIFAFDGESLPDEANIALQLGIHYEPGRGEDLIVAPVTGVPNFGIPTPADFGKLPVVRS